MQKLNQTFHKYVRISVGGWALILGLSLGPLPGYAIEANVPWECSEFIGDAQERCARTFAELQQAKIEQLEKDLALQKQTVRQLETRVAKQASDMVKLEKQFSRKRYRWSGSSWAPLYPPLGLTLRFSKDRAFGGSFSYGRPWYFGPRFYGHGYRRWFRY